MSIFSGGAARYGTPPDVPPLTEEDVDAIKLESLKIIVRGMQESPDSKKLIKGIKVTDTDLVLRRTIKSRLASFNEALNVRLAQRHGLEEIIEARADRMSQRDIEKRSKSAPDREAKEKAKQETKAQEKATEEQRVAKRQEWRLFLQSHPFGLWIHVTGKGNIRSGAVFASRGVSSARGFLGAISETEYLQPATSNAVLSQRFYVPANETPLFPVEKNIQTDHLPDFIALRARVLEKLSLAVSRENYAKIDWDAADEYAAYLEGDQFWRDAGEDAAASQSLAKASYS